MLPSLPMKRLLIILHSSFIILLSTGAQDIPSVLQTIEQNNTTLQALRRTAEAQQLGHRSDIALADPELGYSYAWGSPVPVENKQTVSVSQRFDLATLSGIKGQVAREKDKLVEHQYRTDRMGILLEAKLHCIDLIYYNALLAELATRLTHAEAIAEAQKKRLDNGEGNRLEYNNVLLSLSALQSEIALMETERTALLSELSRLNGGNAIDFRAATYEHTTVPTDFQHWYAMMEAKNPALAYAAQEVLVGCKEVTLTKTHNLPSISLGYAGEFEAGGNRHQGISVGIGLPLWSNKNRLRQARAAVEAAQARQADAQEQWYANLQILHQRTLGLQAAAEAYRSSLAQHNNSQLLKKALDEGEISVLDYLVGIGLYYDTVDKALQAEREYQRAHAQLTAVEL